MAVVDQGVTKKLMKHLNRWNVLTQNQTMKSLFEAMKDFPDIENVGIAIKNPILDNMFKEAQNGLQ